MTTRRTAGLVAGMFEAAINQLEFGVTVARPWDRTRALRARLLLLDLRNADHGRSPKRWRRSGKCPGMELLPVD